MKVVLFCGGRGLRLREHSEAIPKPMVRIGYRPILWHVMRSYAHYGYRDFILCLGYRGDAIKDYFLRYEEALSNDFVLSDGGRRVELLGSDIEDWRITFADTGLDATIGERLRRVRHHLEGEELFLANYGDTLTDAPLDRLVEEARESGAVATVLSVIPPYSFHFVDASPDGLVERIRDVGSASVRINGGGYVFTQEIFDHLESGEDLVDAPFRRLAAASRVRAFEHDGFWVALDTLKELQLLQDLEARGDPPWAPGADAMDRWSADVPVTAEHARIGAQDSAGHPPAGDGSGRSAGTGDPRHPRWSARSPRMRHTARPPHVRRPTPE
jgi:glucose-1-phosphate cytidylyltransferase